MNQANTEAPQSRITPDRSPSGGEAGTSAYSAAAAAPRRPAPTKMNPAMAGVSGILRKEQEQQEEVDKNMKEAFQDLNGLMVRSAHDQLWILLSATMLYSSYVEFHNFRLQFSLNLSN